MEAEWQARSAPVIPGRARISCDDRGRLAADPAPVVTTVRPRGCPTTAHREPTAQAGPLRPPTPPAGSVRPLPPESRTRRLPFARDERPSVRLDGCPPM